MEEIVKLPLDLAGLVATAVMSSSLVTNGSMRALPVRHTAMGYQLVDGEWWLLPHRVGAIT
jgi:hypothetical protein